MLSMSRRGLAFVEVPIPLIMSSFVSAIKPEVAKKYGKPAYSFSNTEPEDFLLQKGAHDPEEINCFEEPDSILIMQCIGDDIEKTRRFMAKPCADEQIRILIVSGSSPGDWFYDHNKVNKKIIKSAMRHRWLLCVINAPPSPIARALSCHQDYAEVFIQENIFMPDELFSYCVVPQVTQIVRHNIYLKLLDIGVVLEWDGLSSDRLITNYFLYAGCLSVA